MNTEYQALRVPAGEDLLPLIVLLRDKGIACRVFEEDGQQVLCVLQQEHCAAVASIYRQWRDGDIQVELVRAPQTQNRREPLWKAVFSAPFTLLLIMGSIAGFLLVQSQSIAAMGWFTFLPLTEVGGRLGFGSAQGQFWRFVTPVFLHFGLLHVTFNSLWTWELGAKVERTIGAAQMFGLFLVMAIVSNVAQFVFSGPSLFGGMSGVVYGLLGFCWVAGSLNPAWSIKPRNGLMLFMLGWLVFCMTGAMETLGFGAIANAAHVGGLLAGAALAIPMAWLARA